VLVGARAIRGHENFGRNDLVGSDCARATHVISRIDQGGFVMMVSGGGDAKPELIDRGGDADACDRARAERREDPQCAVPLRVGLLPIVTPAPELACDEDDPAPNAMPATPPPASFTRIDAEIRRTQSRPSKYVYAGSIFDVLGDGKSRGAFPLDVQEARAFAQRLEKEVVEKGDAPEWSIVALAREAEMFERLRDALANLQTHPGPGPAPPGKISLFTPQQTQLMGALRGNGLASKVAELNQAVLDFWNVKKQQALDEVDTEILASYARAATAVETKNPAAMRAVRRLARYTRLLGNPKMAKLLGRGYVPDRYLRACAALDRSESP
jgi:hypothetical protein